ncbi:MAG: hypothetical protein DRN59_03695, partial [Thaumarchaeota archaeon]
MSEPEDYFNPEEEKKADLSRYTEEAERIKVIKDADWDLIIASPQPEKPAKPSKPTFGIKVPKLPKVKIPQLSKTQIALAAIILVAFIGGAWAASTYLSHVINTSLEVQAPEQMSLTLQNWPSSVIQGINYSFALRISNNNPSLPGVFEFKFSRADGVNLSDIDVYLKDPSTGNYTKLSKTIAGNTLIIRSNSINFPTGTIT